MIFIVRAVERLNQNGRAFESELGHSKQGGDSQPGIRQQGHDLGF